MAEAIEDVGSPTTEEEDLGPPAVVKEKNPGGLMTENDYDKIHLDYDFGYTIPKFILDFTCTEEMVQNLDDCIINKEVIKCMNLVDLNMESAIVSVKEKGRIWLLVDESKYFMLRRYTDLVDALRVYDGDVTKVEHVKRPSLRELAAWYNVKLTSLQSLAERRQWAKERRANMAVKHQEERQILELVAREEYEEAARRNLATLNMIIDKGRENIENGGVITIRDTIQSIGAMERIYGNLMGVDKSGNTNNILNMFFENGMLAPVGAPIEAPVEPEPEVVEAEFEVLPEKTE